MAKKKLSCASCSLSDLSKNTVGINQKLLGEDITIHYCMECLASYLDVTVLELEEKIEEFKNEGCTLFH